MLRFKIKLRTINKRHWKYLAINYWPPDIPDLVHSSFALRSLPSDHNSKAELVFTGKFVPWWFTGSRLHYTTRSCLDRLGYQDWGCHLYMLSFNPDALERQGFTKETLQCPNRAFEWLHSCASRFGGLGFISRPGDRCIFCLFSVIPGKCQDCTVS
jgi:hypothetical protein